MEEKELIINLLKSSEVSIEKIATLVNVNIDKIRKIKKEIS